MAPWLATIGTRLGTRTATAVTSVIRMRTDPNRSSRRCGGFRGTRTRPDPVHDKNGAQPSGTPTVSTARAS
ncbi:hypothetical protein GCM10007977_000580 [Dactylosporangium sucinum]|uniref:Uncharacterized protein n=1 Tax=Dactylosporangium sucinum TaxID=1424081 RepID=A0A917SZS4_9ACTN|nr:hypothetical protein GCM10007977_000580 [Dactylosporangium sucinum]